MFLVKAAVNYGIESSKNESIDFRKVRSQLQSILENIDAVMLMSDEFYQLIDLFQSFSFEGFFFEVSEKEIIDLHAILYELQVKDNIQDYHFQMMQVLSILKSK